MLEWDLKVKIRKKIWGGGPNLHKNWSKIDLSLSLGSNNLVLLAN